MSYDIEELDGPQQGEYFIIKFSDGRQVSVSRKPGDKRVWLGRTDDPASYRNQRGGIGTIDRVLDDLRPRLTEAAPEDLELYHALSELKARRDVHLAERA
jgi:hypothetical protein